MIRFGPRLDGDTLRETGRSTNEAPTASRKAEPRYHTTLAPPKKRAKLKVEYRMVELADAHAGQSRRSQRLEIGSQWRSASALRAPPGPPV